MPNIKLKLLVISMAFALAEMSAGEPQIQEYLLVKTHVANRFAETSVTSKFVNTLNRSTVASFAVFLPEQASISNFYLEIDGERHQSIVTKGLKTEIVPNGAVYNSASVRSSRKIGIDVWLDPNSTVLFHLEYEQLMVKVGGQYEITTNIIPGSLVPKLEVEIVINETNFLELKRDPFLRSGVDFDLIPGTDLQVEQDISNTSAVIRFRPNVRKQLELVCAGLRNEAFEGLSGQLVVQYDVKMEHEGGLTITSGDYFVSYFSPTKLKPMPKHIVFILDGSGSMRGAKLEYLKKAMNNILPQLLEEDLFDIVEFHGTVYVWKINHAGKVIKKPAVTKSTNIHAYGHLANRMRRTNLPSFFRATAANIEKILETFKNMTVQGRTNTMGALETGLFLTKSVQEAFSDHYLPIIVFLTDGQPTIGISRKQEIINKITAINKKGVKAPIYSIAFGNDVNWKFLRGLSLRSGARAVKIEIADDTAEHLDAFYREISEPYLNDVRFRKLLTAANKTRSKSKIYFKGSELMIAGKGTSGIKDMLTTARDNLGIKHFVPQFRECSKCSLERIWANLMISQLTEKFYATQNRDFLKRSQALAKKKALVTEFTSLVIKKKILNTKNGMQRYIPEAAADPLFCFNISAYITERYHITTEAPEATTTEATTTEAPETITIEAPETTTTETPETTTTKAPAITRMEAPEITTTEAPETTTTEAPETTTIEAPETTTTETPETTTTKAPAITRTEAPETTTTEAPETTTTEAPETITTEAPETITIEDSETTTTETLETTTTEAPETTTTKAPAITRTEAPETTTTEAPETTTTEAPETTTTETSETTTIEASESTTTETPETTTTKAPAITRTEAPETTTTEAPETTTTEAPETTTTETSETTTIEASESTTTETPETTTTKAPAITRTEALETTTTEVPETTTTETPETTTTKAPAITRSEAPETTTTEAPETTTTEAPETTTTEAPKITTTKAPKIKSKILECFMRAKSCEGGKEEWFYNRLSGRCAKFNGCKGQAPIFDSEETCEDVCVRAEGKKRCELPVTLGECTDFVKKWFYFKRKNACIEYEYGGCLGNTNRFDTKQECSEMCIT